MKLDLAKLQVVAIHAQDQRRVEREGHIETTRGISIPLLSPRRPPPRPPAARNRIRIQEILWIGLENPGTSH